MIIKIIPKIFSFVKSPVTLDLKDLKDLMDDNLLNLNINYSLYGIIHHVGEINFGHYFSEIIINDSWYIFNDSEVKRVENIDLNNNTVCVLFYNKFSIFNISFIINY